MESVRQTGQRIRLRLSVELRWHVAGVAVNIQQDSATDPQPFRLGARGSAVQTSGEEAAGCVRTGGLQPLRSSETGRVADDSADTRSIHGRRLLDVRF